MPPVCAFNFDQGMAFIRWVGALAIILVGPWERAVAQPKSRQNPTPQQMQQLLIQQQIWIQQQLQARAILQFSPPAKPDQLQNSVPGAKSARVLFIGNNYTSTNQLPALLAAMARAAKALPLESEVEALAGASLEQHVKQGKAVQKIRQAKWDVVVLQEKCLEPVLSPETTLQSALILNQEINKVGARALYFQTWAPRNRLEAQDQISLVNLACAQQSQAAAVAPVGRAFLIAQAADLNLMLYQKDNNNPSPAGTYLAACVLYASIYGQSPVGLPNRLGQGGKVLVALPEHSAQLLQQAALDAVLGN